MAPPPARGRGGWRLVLLLVAALALIVSGIVVGALVGSGGDEGAAGDETPAAAGVVQDPPVEDPGDEPIAEVAAAVGPAVVQVETQEGLGSGVVYDESGLLLTNAHVVGAAEDVVVRLADGSQTDGVVLGADESTDVAVVEIPADEVVGVACLALDDTVRVGQTAVGIGSPFGLEQTVTAGIVSAVDRPFPNGEILVGMLQTDAPINSGNSGGALADRSGCVMGINTAIFSNSGDNSGIGFAIPIEVAYDRAQTIVNGGSLETGFLGLSGEGTDDGEPGVLVTEVESDSAAEQAGVEEGDVIIGLDGEDVKDIGALAVMVSEHSPGDEVTLEVERDGDTREITVELGAR